jgi:malate dehydrogenase (quinone)
MLDCDVLLVGAGIMSATVGTFLKELDPELTIQVVEKLDRVAGESSHARNNAGTGHSALCELNYTSPRGDGSIDISRAIHVMESFEVSKQFWAWLVRERSLAPPTSFIRAVPHLSFVWGEEDVTFLRRRFEALSSCALFHGMKFSENRAELSKWMPLVMQSRDPAQKIAATRSELGTDVDFGELTRGLFAHLARQPGVGVNLGHEVLSLGRDDDGRWLAKITDDEHGRARKTLRARFVFLGAGGGALSLLEKCEIPEGSHYGGFPVSGQWLVCRNPALVERHHAKVYGKAKVGAPPMSVPHLDSRVIEGKRELMFGPFAGFSTKFLKSGSYLDLPLSITPENIWPLISAGIHNVPLTRYLISQVTQTFEDKMSALREFVPEAINDDWELAIAGQRVQVIKKDEHDGGRLEFGTEIVSAADNTIAALLGASPGASTSVSIALDLLADCFPEEMKTPAWQTKLAEMVPSHGKSLSADAALATRARSWSHERLSLPIRTG